MALPPRFPRPAPRSPAERLAAWLYTGPLGHLYGMAADVAELSARYALARARARLGAAVAGRRRTLSPNLGASRALGGTRRRGDGTFPPSVPM